MRCVGQACQEPGCRADGVYPAPMGRHTGRRYYWFCLEHVRLYNKAYNYFEGMSEAEILAFQKSAVTGHRPTWVLGSLGGWRRKRFFWGQNHKSRVRVSPRVREAFRVLGLDWREVRALFSSKDGFVI